MITGLRAQNGLSIAISTVYEQVSKKDVQKAANSMDDSDSFDVSFEDDECSYQPTTGAKRSIPTASPHRPSALQSSSRGPYIQAGGSNASAITVGPRTISETKGVTGRAQSSSTGTDRTYSTEDQSKEADQVIDIGFMPSFLEPDKQSRQKRYNLLRMRRNVRNSILFHPIPALTRDMCVIRCNAGIWEAAPRLIQHPVDWTASSQAPGCWIIWILLSV